MMKQFYLAEITTKDKLIHQGFFYKPKSAGKKAILWVHGLTDNFYGDFRLMEELSEYCEKEGYGLAAFNNRGHDVISSVSKIDPTKPKGKSSLLLGSSYENFRDCVYDIDAGISFLIRQGFFKIILAGTSTGANKTCYYAGTKEDKRLAGIVLCSPVSDRLIPTEKVTWYKRLLLKTLVSVGLGDKLLTGLSYFPATPNRYLSLITPHSLEDAFDYGDHVPQMTFYSKITQPLLVFFGSRDEYLDRPVEKVRKVFNTYQHSKKYKSVVIQNAFHSYNGKEIEIAREVINWITTL